jgi:putative serine protease PepD
VWTDLVEYATSSQYVGEQFPQEDGPLFDIYNTVVEILCVNAYEISGGSGTNLQPEGLILTNDHVLSGPEDTRCVVGFIDPLSGVIAEVYWLKDGYTRDSDNDLALALIGDPVVDEEGNVYGYKSRVDEAGFPYYKEPLACADYEPVLGEYLYIIGYPALAGGSLTVTDGLVSSLYSPDGYLITSAKIGAGNSGGLAINADACMVGVPSATYSEEDEVYGEIVDGSFVREFLVE